MLDAPHTTLGPACRTTVSPRQAMLATLPQEKGREELEHWKATAAAKERMLNEREAALREQARQAAEAAAAARLAEENLAMERAQRMQAVAAKGSATAPATPNPLNAAEVASAVAAMSREEKIEYIKKLKEERKALHIELGIEPEPPKRKEEAEAAAQTERSAPPSEAAVKQEPQPTFSVGLKCFGFHFTMTVTKADHVAQ